MLYLPPAPAIIIPKAPDIVRPGDPRYLVGASVMQQMLLAGGSGSVSAEVAQWLARASLDSMHIAADTAYIDGLVAAGLWSKFDWLHIYATQTSTIALLNMISSSYAGIAHGSPTFTADRGFTGIDASNTVYIDSQFNPTTAPSPKYTQNSAHIAAWSNTSTQASASGGVMIGHFNGGGELTYLIPRRPTDISYYDIAGNTNPSTVSNSDSTGHYIATRDTSTTTQGYKNGSSVLTASVGSIALLNNNIIVMAGNDGGIGPTAGAGLQHCMASAGALLSSTDATNFYNLTRARMTAVGVP